MDAVTVDQYIILYDFSVKKRINEGLLTSLNGLIFPPPNAPWKLTRKGSSRQGGRSPRSSVSLVGTQSSGDGTNNVQESLRTSRNYRTSYKPLKTRNSLLVFGKIDLPLSLDRKLSPLYYAGGRLMCDSRCSVEYGRRFSCLSRTRPSLSTEVGGGEMGWRGPYVSPYNLWKVVFHRKKSPGEGELWGPPVTS